MLKSFPNNTCHVTVKRMWQGLSATQIETPEVSSSLHLEAAPGSYQELNSSPNRYFRIEELAGQSHHWRNFPERMNSQWKQRQWSVNSGRSPAGLALAGRSLLWLLQDPAWHQTVGPLELWVKDGLWETRSHNGSLRPGVPQGEDLSPTLLQHEASELPKTPQVQMTVGAGSCDCTNCVTSTTSCHCKDRALGSRAGWRKGCVPAGTRCSSPGTLISTS